MKRLAEIIKGILDFFIYGNFFIAFCAALLIYESYILFNTKAGIFYPAFGFVATFFVYNIDRVISPGNAGGMLTSRQAWLIANFRKVVAFTAISGIFLLVSVFYVHLGILLFLMILGLVSVGYSIPIVFKGKSLHGLRSIKGLKIFLITFVWAATTVILPAIDSRISLLNKEVVLLFIERCFFIFIITLPFDIRDYKSDIKTNVKTIPGMIGIEATRRLAFACIAVFLAVSFYHYPLTNGLFWARFISAITTLFFVHKAKEHYHEYYFTGLLDGTMVIQFILIYFLHNIRF
jgi:4-hydroxybenzoate polyprenyltransferase